jgi:hypothetical protein
LFPICPGSIDFPFTSKPKEFIGSCSSTSSEIRYLVQLANDNRKHKDSSDKKMRLCKCIMVFFDWDVYLNLK